MSDHLQSQIREFQVFVLCHGDMIERKSPCANATTRCSSPAPTKCDMTSLWTISYECFLSPPQPSLREIPRVNALCRDWPCYARAFHTWFRTGGGSESVSSPLFLSSLELILSRALTALPLSSLHLGPQMQLAERDRMLAESAAEIERLRAEAAAASLEAATPSENAEILELRRRVRQQCSAPPCTVLVLARGDGRSGAGRRGRGGIWWGRGAGWLRNWKARLGESSMHRRRVYAAARASACRAWPSSRSEPPQSLFLTPHPAAAEANALLQTAMEQAAAELDQYRGSVEQARRDAQKAVCTLPLSFSLLPLPRLISPGACPGAHVLQAESC